MKIAETAASILLTEEGRHVFRAVGIDVAELTWTEIDVAESEDLGLWIRIEGTARSGMLLVRWEYIQAVYLLPRLASTLIGLKGIG